MDTSLIEAIKNNNTSLFHQAIKQGVEFEPKKRVYKFNDKRYNIIEIAALMGCDKDVFLELKERGAIPINEGHGTLVESSMKTIGEQLVSERFLKVVFSLLEIGVKLDYIAANLLIRADCTLEQLKRAMEQYKIKFSYTTLAIALKSGWLLKSSEHLKFIQSSQKISNENLNKLIIENLIARRTEDRLIYFDVLFECGLKLGHELRQSVFYEAFYYYYHNNQFILSDKGIEQLIMLIGAGAEIYRKDFTGYLKHLSFNKENHIYLTSLMIEQLLQKGCKPEKMAKYVGKDVVKYYKHLLEKKLDIIELVRQVLDARSTSDSNLYEYVSNKVDSARELAIRDQTSDYWKGRIEQEAKDVLHVLRRLIFVKRLIVETKARVYSKQELVYDLAQHVFENKEKEHKNEYATPTDIGAFIHIPTIGKFLDVKDTENLSRVFGIKREKQFLVEHYTKNKTDVEIAEHLGWLWLLAIQESEDVQQLAAAQPIVIEEQEPIAEQEDDVPLLEQEEPIAEQVPVEEQAPDEEQGIEQLQGPVISIHNPAALIAEKKAEPDQNPHTHSKKYFAIGGATAGLCIGLTVAYFASAVALASPIAIAVFVAAAIVGALVGTLVGALSGHCVSTCFNGGVGIETHGQANQPA